MTSVVHFGIMRQRLSGNQFGRPLEPVDLPEHQRVTLVLPTEDETVDEQVGYESLPLQQRKTIRVRLKRVGDFGPLSYEVAPVEMEQE
jgi:hypothetical protein